MKKPRYTDSHRYLRPYRRTTNVAATFRRVREEQAKATAEVKEKVRALPTRKKGEI